MIALLIGTGFSLALSLFGTGLLVRILVRRGTGQFIRDDGPTTHHTKRGTPTMGGLVIIVSVVLSYVLTHGVYRLMYPLSSGPTMSGWLVLFLMTGMGIVGFLDDTIKVTHQRSLGLRARTKILLQLTLGTIFSLLSLNFPDPGGRTPATTKISFARDINMWDLAFFGSTVGVILFVIWANLIISGATNAVNLTDGLDGLATGASIMFFGAYVLVAVWQFYQRCEPVQHVGGLGCYSTRDPLDLALISSILFGALIGFLWWNTSPAKIFMGDTGSFTIGGAIAALAIMTHTELLLPIFGGLFLIITASVIIQVGYFKMTKGKRVFKMAPLQHHFELKGWNEVTVVVRFWILAGLCVALGVSIFYAEWILQQ